MGCCLYVVCGEVFAFEFSCFWIWVGFCVGLDVVVGLVNGLWCLLLVAMGFGGL